ncbi:MAG: hypothetical protein QOD75_3284 [Blastocatellia bacterium]|nr:hypothetical protein [Blastocatellia bacterium]
MRKQLLTVLGIFTFTLLSSITASAQLPGGLKVPRPGKPKPTPTPAEKARPAPSGETQPAAPTQPGATNAEASPRPPAEGSALIKTLIQFWPYTLTSYQGEYNNVWSWIPTVRFTTDGAALPSGGQYYVEVTQPGGAAWVKLKCVNTTYGGPTFECGDRNDLEKSGTLAIGLFPFAIKMRNPLEGTEKTLFIGRAKVEKVLTSGNIPTASKQFVYYANQDWNLPIGQVYVGDDGHLNVRFWIRGEPDGADKEAHLFYRGEEVGLFEKYGEQYGGSRCSPDIEYRPTRDAGPAAPQGAKWARLNCTFSTVAAKPNSNAPEWHVLGANPGDYEIKVLRNKRLARSIKFAAGPDGRIVDNRIAPNNGMTWDNFIFVPVTIIGEQDGTWDKNAWKTEAFYGHPLTGFNWPPQ